MRPSSTALRRIRHDNDDDKGHDVVEAFRAAVYDSLVKDAQTAYKLAAQSKRILDDCVLANGGYDDRAMLGVLDRPVSYLAVASAAAVGLSVRARVDDEDTTMLARSFGSLNELVKRIPRDE
ncbi:hypothetical protein M885DRAFT_573292 [Pelagophyceae sp. CCMP2097]|nr:hypothetical protein M885DRAFT_573292 [Pelagophyceae sp. CCMP2097]